MPPPTPQVQPPVALDRDGRPTPGAARPGGRTARTGAAVLAATLAELASGYEGLTLEAVASRAGVHKTTVYRRWGNRERLVAHALQALAQARVEVPNTGDFDQDLRLLARSVVTTLTSHEGAGTVRAMVVGAASSEVVHGIVVEFWEKRTAQAGIIVTRALDRHDVPPGTSLRGVIHHLGAPLYHQLLVTLKPLSAVDADTAAAATAAAARAGVFAPGTPAS